MSESGAEMISRIMQWAEDHPTINFDTTFVQSVSEYYKDKGRVTDAQHNALANIIRRWKMQ